MRLPNDPAQRSPLPHLPSLSTGYHDLPLSERKQLWRSFIRNTRRSYPELERSQMNQQLGYLLNELLIKLTPVNATNIKVAAFMPTATEPGFSTLIKTLTTGSWISSIKNAEIFLPITLPAGVLRWAPYRGEESLTPGPMGILEPQCEEFQDHSSEVLTDMDFIIVPALATNCHGQRLGQGGGYYDRALSLLDTPRPTLITLLFPGELHPDIPVEAHDQKTDYVITPEGTSRPEPNV